MFTISRVRSAIRKTPRIGVGSSRDASLQDISLEPANVDISTRLRYDRKRSAEIVITSISSMTPEMAISYLQSTNGGLGEEDVSTRFKITGPNVLSTSKSLTWWQLLLRVIPNSFNILLTLLAVISVATPTPEWSTFAILMVMIVISVIVRFWQEYRSNIAAIKLQESVSSTVCLRRQVDGKMWHLNIEETKIVPGDIVVLSPGDKIPADCLVLDGALQVSQSSLSGESEPVRKSSCAQQGKTDVSLFDLENICFMGTSVISGSGAALVLRTGDDACIATIMKQLKKKRPLNSFQRGTRNVSLMMLGFMVVLVPLVLVISAKSTGSWHDAALFSISVAVGLVPEMLPAIVNGNLARGAFMLAKKEAIVKRLDAIQNLGGMSVLCSDKTGTLTKDQISLCHYIDPEGRDEKKVLKLAYINALYQSGKTNSIDSAIIKCVDENKSLIGGPLGRKVAEIPFNFERRRSSCIIRTPTGKLLLICKGAFEEMSMLCTTACYGLGTSPVNSEEVKAAIEQRVRAYNNDGYRVIAVATKQLNDWDMTDADSMDELESSMKLVGLLTFLDPPKDDAATSIAQLHNLGVEVKVLTGDNLGVAMKVSRSLNLVRYLDEEGAQAISGPALARMDSDEFDSAAKTCKIFAKLTPSQKGDVILSLKKAGENVGMLGDGINDCVALRFADAGISVDTGAPVAKSCADVILTRKELSIVVDCVTIGRLTHGNTIKYIKMVASSNFGNVFSVLIASAWLPYNPMSSLQILIQNLLYDISQIAIPWDRMDDEYLVTPKRWDAKDLLRFIVVLGPTSSTIDMCTFCLNWFYYGIKTAQENVAKANTHWFLQGLLTQTLIVHMLRTAKVPVFQSRASKVLISTTVSIIVIGFAVPYIPPFQKVLGLVRPANSFVGFLAAELLLYCMEVQLIKMVYIRLFKNWL